MNRQQVFKRICDGLAKQGFQLCGGPFACRYRKGKLGCAIGVLVPPRIGRKWDSCFSGPIKQVIKDFPSDVAKYIGKVTGDDLPMLEACQNAHDDSHTPLEIKENLIAVAGKWGLRKPRSLRITKEEREART